MGSRKYYLDHREALQKKNRERYHETKRPYMCLLCDKVLASLPSVRSHLRAVHPAETARARGTAGLKEFHAPYVAE